MVKLLLLGGSLQRSNSSGSALCGVACVLGALLASCANGTTIGSEDVVFLSPARPVSEREPAAPEDVEQSTDPAQAAGDGELSGTDEASEGGPDDELDRADQSDGDEPPATDDDPGRDDPEQIPPSDVPIVDPEPDPDIEDPDIDADPVTPPDPTPDLTPDDDGPAPNPVVPPVTEPTPVPVPTPAPDDVPAPALPASGHCLAGWEGSSCDTCSGQTQSDRLACRLYIDCYITIDCDPATCGSVEQACGVNRLGNGLAPKEIADSVYSCMCQ